ncbi:MAG: PAS domain-containing protein [Anaerolineae bacterium]|jgi:PAS domain S-box-containing protein
MTADMETLLHKLQERVKELNCLFQISDLIGQADTSLPEILQGTAEIIPSGWQYPEITRARITWEGQEFKTDGFRATAWQQTGDIRVDGERAGRVEVCYLESRPDADEGPFLKEERSLLNAIVERLGRIIERVQAEHALRRYQTIVAAVSDPISYVDRDYRYVVVNEVYAAYAKRPREEILGLSIAELLGEEAFVTSVKPHLDRCLAGEAVRYQAWFDVPGESRRCMDVGYYPVFDDSGQAVVGAVVASRDITGRQRATEALQRERNLVRRIMETSPIGIIVFDTQGRITYANQLVQQISGLSESDLHEQAYNAPLWHLLDEDGNPLSDEDLPFAQVMNSSEAIHDVRFVSELSDGQRLSFSANAAPLINKSGRLDGVVVTVEDITAGVQAKEQAEQAAAAAERERLARDLHDAVTQTLFSVAAIAEALPRVWERDPQEARSGLEALRQLTQGALAEMRTMLLELRPSSLAEHDLGTLLRQLTEAMTGRTQMPITIGIEGECSLPVEVRIALYRIAQEALHNIAKHAQANQAWVDLSCSATHAELRIRDDGGGFEPQTIDPHRLGLSIMHERARAIGAMLKIDSQPGQGTVVVAHWPSSQESERDG